MENKEFYRLITWGLIVFSLVTDFAMSMTILTAFIVMTIFVIPTMDFTEEYNRIMRGGEFGEETGWKIMTLIVMFFSLITLLHKPISMLLGN